MEANMSDTWKTNPLLRKDLLNQLHQRRNELHNAQGEAALDAALSSDDPLDALFRLAYAGPEKEMLTRAIRRVEAVHRDIKNREQVAERNQRRKAAGLHGIITS
jgi:hypothetical protein